jgi:hypothetical protein
MDRLTKLTVLASMTAAVVVEAALMAGAWPVIFPATIGALVVFCAIGFRFAPAAAAAVLLFAYTFPALVLAVRGRFEYGYMTIWVAALLGVMLPSGIRRGWALPMRWRMPLALWALTVALAWPAIALREVDFSMMTLDVPRLSVTGPPGVPPRLAIAWTLNVTLVLGVGILWFDWLYATFDGAERRFRNVIIGALAASWVMSALVAVYQLFVDVTFLNSGQFGFLQRGSGMMMDANPYGVIAALGIPAVAATALVTRRFGRGAAAGLAVLAWTALWSSGSRTAFAAGVIGTGFAIYYWGGSVIRDRGLTRRLVPAALAAALTLALALLLLQGRSAVGPWQRVQESLPELMSAELWNRNGYGVAATRVIEEFPTVGIGVGAFHYLVLDFSRAVLPGGLPGDNAQNWFRHQLAEFGVVGSLGWILWTLSFGAFVLRTHATGQTQWAVGAVRGGLVAIFVVSLVGMPAQNVAVTLTFWTMAFWFCVLAGEPAPPRAAWARPSTAAWICLWAVVVVFVAGTVYSARDQLRVPFRAARFGWPYSYGFFAPETGPGGQFRWAGRKAVAVVDAPEPWMKLTVSVNHADVARRPVAVRVWRDGDEVLKATLRSAQPVIEYVRVPEGRQRVVLETWVDRVVRPADFGVPDPRELGVMVQWEFVAAP